MEMDTFRGVLILHFLSMITPQYHHIFFILWNSLSFSSDHFGRFNARYLIPPPGNVPRCWFITLKCNVSTGVGFSGKGCASFWAHLHPAFEASLPGENPKCFERKIFFQYFFQTYAIQLERKLYRRLFVW